MTFPLFPFGTILSFAILFIILKRYPVGFGSFIITKFQFGVFPFSCISLFISFVFNAALEFIFTFLSFSLVLLIISSIFTFFALILCGRTLSPLYITPFNLITLVVSIVCLNLSFILPDIQAIINCSTIGSVSIFFRILGLKIAS